ncbi:MAG: M1 family metallopeptidase [Christensenellaceae bacterium]|jgi:hypothetical protein|nr:M1 family metallopeptidase [Christensenellaceae bacterium]
MTKQNKILVFFISIVLLAGIWVTTLYIGKYTRQDKVFDLAALSTRYSTINMDIKYDDKKHQIYVSQTTEYLNTSRTGLSQVKFHAYANAYQKNAQYPVLTANEYERAYPNGQSYGGIEIKSCSSQWNLEGADNTVLSVNLSNYLGYMDKATIKFEYVVQLANIKHRLGWTSNTVNLGNFYPVPVVYDNGWQIHEYSTNGDPFYNELINFNVTITAPNDYQVASSGQQTAPNTFKAYAIRDYAAVLSKNFSVKKDGIISYYYLDDPTPELSLQTANKALDFFSSTFLQYPYPTLTVVETDFLHGGMEYGTLIYVANDTTDPFQYQNVIVHEIAHQWWYGIVGNNQTKTAFIDEGLAEYSTAIFFENHKEFGKGINDIANENMEILAWYKSIVKEIKSAEYDENMNRDINDFNTGYEYTFCTYQRGMLLYYNLGKLAGFERINDGLKLFANAVKFKFGTIETLKDALRESLNTDIDRYVDQFIAGRSY